MDDKTLAKLVKKAKKGDEEAFTTLIEEYVNLIYYIVRQFIYEEPDVEDVVQLTVIRIWEKLHMYNPKDGPFNNWIAVMSINVYKNFLRDYKSDYYISDDVYKTPDANISNTYAEDKYEKEYYSMNKLKEILNEDEYDIIYLRFVLDYKLDDIYKMRNYTSRKKVYRKFQIAKAKIVYHMRHEFKILEDSKTEYLLKNTKTTYDIKAREEGERYTKNKSLHNYELELAHRIKQSQNNKKTKKEGDNL